MSERAGKKSTRYKNKYNSENYDSLRIITPKGRKEEIAAHAKERGESLNAFVNRAIAEAMERDRERG